MQADVGNKYDKGEGLINKVLSLIVDIEDHELDLLINSLIKEQKSRHKGRNLDTIHT